ncbi:kinase-like domain-containing protein [Lasiosphaeris hirsuta]|uniref:Kinase-like domain-containing protein n=1 Tax=Lasiosphaeris hirsuta TaxID=260670 RepID=A0AA40A7F3_9PEZI|nr:kinase-like domain-containing protein [Lasiosphaeris hirsuta]
MSVPTGSDDISSQVKDELRGTSFECDEVAVLTGGNANFVFRGHLAKPLPSGAEHVLIKHGEGYVSSNPSFKLPTSRCVIESESLRALGNLAPAENKWCRVRTPELYQFNDKTNTQIQEYLPDAIDLKNYVPKHYEPNTPPSKKAECLGAGEGLGRWLKDFHDWAVEPEQTGLREGAAANAALQKLKHATYYQYLLQFVDKFPAILSDSRPLFEQVKAMADAELGDDTKLQTVHGDFWTGNVLLPDKPISPSAVTPMFVVDWEVVSLGVRVRDVAQMMAELYMHKVFKEIDAGAWLMEGFVAGYGGLTPEQAFRAAIHIGCHLVVIGGSVQGWGSPEAVERVVALGRDMIVKGWQKDREWFAGRVVSCLFG